MSKLEWDKIGERFYETGVSKAVLYLQKNGKYPKGVAWSGISSVSQSPSGAEETAIYADNQKYLSLFSAEDLGATVNAYYYPPEFAECDGSAEIAPGVMAGQQTRKPFGLCYQTKLGNDEEGDDYGYKIHIIYGAKASPSDREYETINDSPSAIEFSWELTTTPVNVPGFKPTSHLEIDSTKVSAEKLAALEDILYGTQDEDSSLPLPAEIITMMGVDNVEVQTASTKAAQTQSTNKSASTTSNSGSTTTTV